MKLAVPLKEQDIIPRKNHYTRAHSGWGKKKKKKKKYEKIEESGPRKAQGSWWWGVAVSFDDNDECQWNIWDHTAWYNQIIIFVDLTNKWPNEKNLWE